MYKEVAIMWKNKGSYVDEDGVFGLSIIKHVTLQKKLLLMTFGTTLVRYIYLSERSDSG